MEEKDVNSIAGAVTTALAKLNADAASDNGDKLPKDEVFRCPECGGTVTGGVQFCASCGCELEWED